MPLEITADFDLTVIARAFPSHLVMLTVRMRLRNLVLLTL